MRNHPVKKFPQENYNRDHTFHSNRRRSESSMEERNKQGFLIVVTTDGVLLIEREVSAKTT